MNDFNKFSNIPTSAMDNITTESFGEITDQEIFNTGKHTEDNRIEADNQNGKEPSIKVDKDAQTVGTKLGSIIEGEFATRLLDIAIPGLLVTVIYYIGYKIEKSALQITARDQKVIAPAMQQALDAIEIDFKNPFVNLAFVISIVYGTKLIEAIPEMTKINKKLAKVVNIIQEGKTDNIETETETDNILSPETKFKDEWEKVIEDLMKSGRRGTKSKKGAIAFLLKNEPGMVNRLLSKYGLSELPKDKFIEAAIGKNKSLEDFEL